MITVSLLYLVAFLASLAMTAWFRHYSIANKILDIPNSRSSHAVATPRGGGVAIAVVFVAGSLVLALFELVDIRNVAALVIPGVLVAIIGFFDDRGHLPARWRLLGHFIAAASALFVIKGSPEIDLAGWRIGAGLVSNLAAAVYIVWLLNLYNFMDGIDGIASVEAICVGVSASLLVVLIGAAHLSLLPALLSASVAGFLCWNFPPAKIFMGDAGSGFLGLILATLSLQAAWADSRLFWCWLILLGVFIVDATWTLLRRLIRGEKVHQAHRSHAYQVAARHYGSHRRVTLAVVAINLGWLLPIAICVLVFNLNGFLAVCLAYLPLGWLAATFRAGAVERPLVSDGQRSRSS